jgi:hypothetical protein
MHFQKNRPQKINHARAIEFITANPGTSAAQLCKHVYPDMSPQSRKYTASMLVQLCDNRQIRCQSIDSYVAVE